MLSDLFFASPLPALVIVVGLFVSDSLLTIACARLYQQGAKAYVKFEGSYEITPYHQQDVDALRALSPRFWRAVGGLAFIVTALWWLCTATFFYPEPFMLAMGAIVLIQLTVHIRHLRNYALFRALLAGGAARGAIEYARPAMLQHSALECFLFAGLYLVIFLVTSSWFVLGGVLSCTSTGVFHARLAREHVARPASSAPEQSLG
jgi:hypothetical protein